MARHLTPYLSTVFAAILCLVTSHSAISQALPGGPEVSSPEPTATPLPTPTPSGNPDTLCNAQSGRVYNYLAANCDRCAYMVTLFQDTWILDAKYLWDHDLWGNTIGNNPHGGITTTFDRDDVVLDWGSNADVPAKRMLDEYFNSRIDYCYSPMSGFSSQCVLYDSHGRFAQSSYGTDDPTFSFRMNTPYMWWFGDVRKLWIEDPPGNFTRRDTPQGILFAQGGAGYASFFDADGNRLDPALLVDPNQDAGLYWRQHQPQLNRNSGYSICHTWQVRGVASPVALLMPWCDYRDLEPTIVKFPLDPKNPDAHVSWLGSRCMPLLATDPTGSGKVTSAEQLIGDWTNGGEIQKDGARKQWQHGFKALESFDTDKSGDVSGKELEKLFAWVDANRDGVSDPGELVTLEKLGVSKLHYEGARPMTNGDLFIDKGYEGRIRGKNVEGKLIDWYGTVGSTRESVAMVLPRNAKRNNLIAEPKLSEAECPSSGTSVEGGWKWWLAGDKSRSIRGYLAISSTEEKKLVGQSFALTGAKKRGTPLAAMLASYPLEGTQAKDGKATFEISADVGIVRSDVQLLDNGRRLRGKTVSSSGTGESFSYTWEAERLGCAGRSAARS